MSLSRPFLAASASFSATSSTVPVPRPLKRRASDMTDLAAEPLQGASATFHALPIQHTMLSTVMAGQTHTSAPPSSAVRQQMSGLDPTVEDPTAVFLHPPFEDFQCNPEHPDGLTYLVLAEHPEWFLDARDYNALNNDNPHAIPYPPQLEPPRGWCPAKKKDLKHLGADGWPEGEEPRLRCTFCRRTYAGVNAKSMWRRHVYEKHKIAMANRREGTERVRGRNSNSMSKENKRASSTLMEPAYIGSPSQQELFAIQDQSLSRAKAQLQGSMQPPRAMPVMHEILSDHPVAHKFSMDEFLDSAAHKREHYRPRPAPPPRTSTPPPPPRLHDNGETAGPVLAVSTPKEQQSVKSSSTPLRIRPVVPESPYNPLATPAFRHSPARLPSDQPWRFPSPSHPLHSAATELTLASVVRGEMSPRTPGVGIEFSPVVIGPPRRTPMSSPSVSIFGMKARAQPDLGIFEGSAQERLPWGGIGGLLSGKATPRRLFGSSALRTSTPGSGRGTSDSSTDSSHCFSDITDGSSLLDPPIQLAGEHDPFSLLPGAEITSSVSLVDGESPIIRRSLTMPPPLASAPAASVATPSRLKASWSAGQIYEERSSDDDSDESDDDDEPPKLRYAHDGHSEDGDRDDDSLSDRFGADHWNSDDFEQIRPAKRIRLAT